MLRLLRAPRWIVLGLMVVAVASAFVRLGFWQLGRLEAKQRFNERFEARTALPASDIIDLFPTPPAAAGEVAYRRATATGRFDTANEVLLQSRSYKGSSGHHVLTSLVIAPGRALLVDRGWVPLDMNEPPIPEAAPPTEVTVQGVLFPSQARGRFGPVEPPGPSRLRWRVDIARMQEQLPYAIYPLYLQLLEQQPPQPGEFPKLVTALPNLDEGPHRSYAVQWFSFAAMAVISYLALAYRTSRRTPEPADAD